MRKIIFCLCFTLTLFFIVDTTCYSKGSSGGGRSSVSSSRSSASVSSKPSVSTSKPSTSAVRSSSTTSSYNQQKKDEDKKKRDEEERARRDRDNTTNNYYTRNEGSGFGVGSFLGGLGVGALLFGDDDSPKHSTDTVSSQDGSDIANQTVDKEQLQNATDQLAESKENKPEEESSSIVEIIFGVLVGSFILYNAIKILKRV